jgi:hypothetical protein
MDIKYFGRKAPGEEAVTARRRDGAAVVRGH